MLQSKVHQLICILNDKLVCKESNKNKDDLFYYFLELSTMYRIMESRNYLTAEEAISDLRNG